MPRLTLKRCRQSRLPQVIGVCQDDTPGIAAAANASQERLLFAPEVGDEGWHGTWARTAFNVLKSDPYITASRHIARIEKATVCKRPVNIANEFEEFLEFGSGLMPKFDCGGVTTGCNYLKIFDRGFYPAFRDLTAGHILRIRALSTLDTQGTKRSLIQGTDTFDNIIYSQNGAQRVVGQYLTLVDPFVDTPFTLNTLTGIQKDITNDAVQFWDVDPLTGDETLILTMEPSEEVAGYRRYYLNGLPLSCCPVVNDASGNPTVQVEAIARLNYVPVVVDSDYLLIQNLEALISECQSARYATMDAPSAKLMAQAAHKDAIRYLQGELAHYYGTEKPAVSFHPFGSAKLERQGIGTLM